MNLRIKNILHLVVSILIPLGVGLLSSLLTMDTIDTYRNLIQPSFAPPSWIFAPVWTILYIMMGVASYLVWKSGKPKIQVDNALLFYFTQLSLNFLWSILFFRFDLRLLAFIEIIILLGFIIATTIKFYRINKYSGYLMIPYILWVSFATILNFAIWYLNM